MKTVPGGVRRILVIQLRQLGDVILSTPALKALKRAFPEADISFLTEKKWEAVVRNNPYIRRHFFYCGRGWREMYRLIRELRRQRFDLAVDFQAGPRSAILSFFSGAPRRLGPTDSRHRRIAYNILAESSRGYSADVKLSLLESLGIQNHDIQPDLIYSRSAAREVREFLAKHDIRPGQLVIAVQAVSKYANKTWPFEKTAMLADHLAHRYAARVVYIWGPGEEALVKDALSKTSRRHLLSPCFSIDALAAFLDRADLYLGLCSGPRHLAASQHTPTVTIMGPQLPAGWTHPAPIHRAVYAAGLECRPCNRAVCYQPALYCMDRVTPHQVIHAIQQVAEASPGLLEKMRAAGAMPERSTAALPLERVGN